MQGSVKWFSDRKGYGFITDENGVDRFFHHSDIFSNREFKSLPDGASVQFDGEESEKGPVAKNVTAV